MLDIGRLDVLYRNAVSCDDKTFAEMRSNVLLVSGDHYNKKGSKYWDRVRSSKGLSDATKLRLTKNHVSSIIRRKVARLLSKVPTTTIIPNNEDEMQDQKSAELRKSVWEYYKNHHNLRKKIAMWAEDFMQLGECYCKIFWDDAKGELIGYEPKVDEEGEPIIDEMGEMVPDKSRPAMSGDFVFERVLAFNILRDPESQTIDESPYLICRKMVSKERAMSLAKDPAIAKSISDTSEESFLVFDGDKASYDDESKKVMLREHYYRPCMEYPMGYFYICTQTAIIAEGELPFGIWNIAYAGHTEIPTSARHISPIRQARPYQIEINRTGSKIAETQITLGDDKVILSNGAKMSHGGKLAGIRAVTVTGGKDPSILAGRSGDQYLGYMNSQITELYRIMDEEEYEAESGQFDAYAMLYKSSRNNVRFKKTSDSFENFLIDVTKIFLALSKEYLDEETVIPMIGRSERVNIQEFKNSDDLKHQVKVEATSDDVDTMLGKQLAINHALQYVGKNMEKDDIARLLRAMPFMNKEEALDGLSIDYDMSKNDMLAMERGEAPMINKYDKHKYLIQRAVNRMKKPDYRFLHPMTQQLYQQYVQIHEQYESESMLAQQRATQGFIPIDGPLVTVDYYTTNEEGKTKRAKMPQRSLEWLEEHLTAQGTSLEKIEQMNSGVVGDISQMMQQQGMVNQPDQMAMEQAPAQFPLTTSK